MTAGTPTRRTAAARLTPLACNRLHRQSHTDRAAWGTGVQIGGPQAVLIAGPCSVESRAQTFEVAAALHALGVRVLRGGAFKPRTSPYAFQGLGEPALGILAEVREAFGLAVVTEVMG